MGGSFVQWGTWTYFFHTTVIHDLYLNMLMDTVLPQLWRQHDNGDFFQQDGAPPHCAVTV